MDPTPDRAPRATSPSEAYYERLFADLERGPEAANTAAAATEEAAAIPETIGRYRIVAFLASGGQARTYRAVHPDLGREVVIKIAKRPLAGAAAAGADRLRQEARLLASLDHPGIARVHDLEVHDGKPFLVLEYLRGRTLRQAAEDRRFTPEESAALVAGVARAAEHAHRAGVVHRDIKPDNIVIEELTGADDAASGGGRGRRLEGCRARLIDFGIAHLRDAWASGLEPQGSISGTVEYMAPEQARGEVDRIGPRTDVFALGGVLYFLLTGQPPFAAGEPGDALERVRRCEFDASLLEAPGIPRRLKDACLRALAREPEDRFASAADLAGELERAARPWRLLRMAAAVAAALLLAAAALGWWISGGTREGTPAAPSGQPAVRIEVDRGGAFSSLLEALPLRAGDALRVRAELPAGAEEGVALYWLDTEGLVHSFSKVRLTRSDAGTVLLWPDPDVHDLMTVAGPPGTEVIFLVAGARAMAAEALARKLAAGGPWPEMPADMVLRLELAGVTEIGPRGPGEGRKLEAPWTPHADAWRRELAASCRFAAGWAVPHR